MSGIRKCLEENPDRLFDRLVDNELSAAEQRELLTALEDEPGGWRRCALAFIEANVWRSTLNSVRAEQTALQAGIVVSRERRQRPWAYGWALAASVLVAFACGRHAANSSVKRELAAVHGPLTGGAVVSSVATDKSAADKPAAGHQALSGGGLKVRPPAESSEAAAPGWQTVQLNLADTVAGESEAVEVPCLDVSQADPAQFDQTWLADQDSAVSAQMLQTLQETGYAVTTEMQWWPVEMADGRRVVLPVEQVEVRFVGGELF